MSVLMLSCQSHLLSSEVRSLGYSCMLGEARGYRGKAATFGSQHEPRASCRVLGTGPAELQHDLGVERVTGGLDAMSLH